MKSLFHCGSGVYILPDSPYRLWGSFSKCKFSGKLFKRGKGKRRGERGKKRKREERKGKREGKKEKGKREKGEERRGKN